MKQAIIPQNVPFDAGLELICARIAAVCKANPPPYIHCSKINTFMLNIKEISQSIQTHHYETPKRLPITIRNHFQGFISMLEQFQQIHSHCCRDTCAQFALTTSMREVYNEFLTMRKDSAKHLETLGLSDLASKMIIPETELQSQNEVDVKRISIIIKQLRRRRDVQHRPDVMKHLDCRTASLTELGVSLDDEDTEIITIPELPASLNFLLQFDDLEFGEVIGSGQSGRVVHGFIKSTGEEVAIKVLHTRILSSSDLDMFRREIFTMAVLSHPMLVKFCGYTSDSPFCIVTEYMCNGSLYDFLKTRGDELSPTERTLIALDVARGMEFLHSRGIIHRDLKSLNVLLDSKKRGKIGDFGLSRIKSSAPMTGLIGTTLWMAPEVLLSTPFYDEKVDVYSFGILLWELLTGKPPYDNNVSTELTRDIVEQNKRPPIPKDTPEHLRNLIVSCWEAEPSKRPPFHQIVANLSDPSYQIPGSERMTFLKEAGLSRRNHAYASSSPLSINSHDLTFRHISDQPLSLLCYRFNDNPLRAVRRISEAISAGNIEHINSSLNQLLASSRSKDVDWSTVMPAFLEVVMKCPIKFKNRLLQTFFELIERPGSIDYANTKIISQQLTVNRRKNEDADDIEKVKNLNESTLNLILMNLNFQKYPALFQQDVIEGLLGLSKHPQQPIRIKALLLLFDIAKTDIELCSNIEFINGFLNFTLRKLPTNFLQNILTVAEIILQIIQSIDNKVIERLIMLMKILQPPLLPLLSACIEECFKFENVMLNFSGSIWLTAVSNFDSFMPLFLHFRDTLPNNYPDIAKALCLASEKSDTALETLISFCNIHECMVLETGKRLPINSSNHKLLTKLYLIIVDFDEVYDSLTRIYEFYAVSVYLLNSDKIDKVCSIFKSHQFNSEYLIQSNLCETITNIFISLNQKMSSKNTKNDSTDNLSLQPTRTSSTPSFVAVGSNASVNSSLNNLSSNSSDIKEMNSPGDSSSESISNNNDSSLIPHSSLLNSFQLSFSKSTLKIIEKYQVSIMSLIFTISCKINVPELRPCIPFLFDILENNRSHIQNLNINSNSIQNLNSNSNSLSQPFSSFPHSHSSPSSATNSSTSLSNNSPQHRKESIMHLAFLCLCVFAKYGTENFDFNLLTLFAAKYVNYENQISQDASAFELTSYAASISNLDDVIGVFFFYLKNEKQTAVANFGKMLIKLAEKNSKNVSPANINRLKSIFQ